MPVDITRVSASGSVPRWNPPRIHADVLTATDVTLPVRAKQADAIRALWASTSLLPKLAASKRRVLFIQ